MISPAIESFNESISTLKFASRAKNIKCTPTINGEIEVDPKVLLKKYEEELRNLRATNEEKIVEQFDNSESIGIRESNKENEQVQKQLEKYKQLLLKQRDIMIALTSRLNNRDETILQLRSELETFYTKSNKPSSQINSDANSLDNFNDRINIAKGNSCTYSADKEDRKLKGNPTENYGNFNHFMASISQDENDSQNSVIKTQNSLEKIVKNVSYAENLSSDLCTGLDDIINSLTKQNDSINLHKIAQSILELQSLSHSLKGLIATTSQDTKMTLLQSKNSNVLQNHNNNLINICTFENEQNTNSYKKGIQQTYETSENFINSNQKEAYFMNKSVIQEESNSYNKIYKDNLTLKRAKSEFDKENIFIQPDSLEKVNSQFVNSYFLKDKAKIR